MSDILYSVKPLKPTHAVPFFDGTYYVIRASYPIGIFAILYTFFFIVFSRLYRNHSGTRQGQNGTFLWWKKGLFSLFYFIHPLVPSEASWGVKLGGQCKSGSLAWCNGV